MPKQHNSTRALAAQIGISHVRIAKMRKDGLDDEQIRVRAAQKGTHRRPPVQELSTDDYAQALRRKAEGDAVKIEMENDVRQGSLIEFDVVKHQQVELATGIRNALLGVSARISNEIPSEWRRQIIAVIDREIDSILRDLAKSTAA
jgi:phage terminase Nu1 subunit (DNA packaging protein)